MGQHHLARCRSRSLYFLFARKSSRTKRICIVFRVRESGYFSIQNMETKLYAYLWWIPTANDPAFSRFRLTNENFGQFVPCLPAIDTVTVHRRAVTNEFAVAGNLGKTTYEPAKVTAGDFLKIAEAVVAARTCIGSAPGFSKTRSFLPCARSGRPFRLPVAASFACVLRLQASSYLFGVTSVPLRST